MVRAEFSSQLAAARGLRAALSTSGADAALAAAGLHRERTLEYDTHRYPLRETFAAALGLGREAELERLHGAIAGFSPARERHAAVLGAKSELLLPLTDSVAASGFEPHTC